MQTLKYSTLPLSVSQDQRTPMLGPVAGPSESSICIATKSTIRKANTNQKHQKIRTDYHKLVAKNKYKQAYIIQLLAEKYFLAQRSIEDIVYCS